MDKPQTRHLIVNADDFGLSQGVNLAVAHAHTEGILTSATVMANGPALEHALQTASLLPHLGVGLHINVTQGRPISPPATIPTLLDENGCFLGKRRLLARVMTGRLQLDHLRIEVESQINKLRLSGLHLTHLDSHQHVHVYPAFFQVVVDVATTCGIKAVRLPVESLSIFDFLSCPLGVIRSSLTSLAAVSSRAITSRHSITPVSTFIGTARTGRVTAEWLVRRLSFIPFGATELMVHPGRNDESLTAFPTRLREQREIELRAITDPTVIQQVADKGILLIHYGDLARRAGIT